MRQENTACSLVLCIDLMDPQGLVTPFLSVLAVHMPRANFDNFFFWGGGVPGKAA